MKSLRKYYPLFHFTGKYTLSRAVLKLLLFHPSIDAIENSNSNFDNPRLELYFPQITLN